MSNINNEENNFKEGEVDSDNIMELDEDKFKLNNEPKFNYDINKKEDSVKSEMELSSFTLTGLSNDSTSDIDNKLNIPIITNEKEQKIIFEDKTILLYGNDINNLYPKYLGKMLTLIYIKNKPLIAIGPDCKFFII